MGRDNANIEENQMINRIGVVLEDVGEFGCIGKKFKNEE